MRTLPRSTLALKREVVEILLEDLWACYAGDARARIRDHHRCARRTVRYCLRYTAHPVPQFLQIFMERELELNRRPAAPATDACLQRTSLAPILVIDDDDGTRLIWRAALESAGYVVVATGSADEAIALGQLTEFALILLDLRLGGASGIDVITALRRAGSQVPFLVVSGFVTIPVAVQVTKLGAIDVFEKPLDIDVLLARVASTVLPDPRMCPAALAASTHGSLSAVAARWAKHVLDGTTSRTDPKTLSRWARHVGVSYASLCEACRLAGVRPHDGRDLCRVLRALLRAQAAGCRPEMLLDIGDRRTLRTLLARSGLEAGRTIEEFLEHQRFVETDSEALRALRLLLRQGTSVDVADATPSSQPA